MNIAKSGVAGLTQTERKAFEKFLQALVANRVDSEDGFIKAMKPFIMSMKHVNGDFEKMMKEVALWMKQCVPGGNKKWEAGSEPFASKAGFDLFFKYAPEEIKSILKSGGQPLLNIFSEKLAKDVHASLKTINLEEYEKLVKKVDPKIVINLYEEDYGYTRLGGEEDDAYIARAIGLDYRNAHDDAALAFDVDALIGSESFAAFDRGFTLYVYYNDQDLGGIEAQESGLNEASLKAMIEEILLENGVDSKIKFVGSQEKIDEKTFDIEFELLTTPAAGDESGLISVELTKPELYKEILPIQEEVVA